MSNVVSPPIIPMYNPVTIASPHDDTAELLIGTILLTGIIGLLIYRQNFSWLQNKRAPNESRLVQGTPNVKSVAMITLVIAFLLLIIPPIILRNNS